MDIFYYTRLRNGVMSQAMSTLVLQPFPRVSQIDEDCLAALAEGAPKCYGFARAAGATGTVPSAVLVPISSHLASTAGAKQGVTWQGIGSTLGRAYSHNQWLLGKSRHFYAEVGMIRCSRRHLFWGLSVCSGIPQENFFLCTTVKPNQKMRFRAGCCQLWHPIQVQATPP